MTKRIWPPSSPDQPAKPGNDSGGAGAAGAAPADLRGKIIAAIKQVYDPEIPVNIYDLGLIYELNIDEASRKVDIVMTLTTPNCPEAEHLPSEVRRQVEELAEIDKAHVKLVWDPPWERSMMSEETRIILGLD